MHEGWSSYSETEASYEKGLKRATLVNEDGDTFPINNKNTVVFIIPDLETNCITSTFKDPSNPNGLVVRQHLYISDNEVVDALGAMNFLVGCRYSDDLEEDQEKVYVDMDANSLAMEWDVLDEYNLSVTLSMRPEADDAFVLYESPVYLFKPLEGVEWHFTHYNTRLHFFSEVPVLNCIVYESEDGRAHPIFGEIKVMDELLELEYPSNVDKRPITREGREIYRHYREWLHLGINLDALASPLLGGPPEEELV